MSDRSYENVPTGKHRKNAPDQGGDEALPSAVLTFPHGGLEVGSSVPQGRVPQLTHFTTLSLMGLSLSILNTWNTAVQSIYTSLPAGGTTAMVDGILVGGFGSLFIALSLGEICHVLPLSGGQYHWTYILAPERYREGLSYSVGWLACAGWITLAASAPYFATSLVLSIAQGFYPDFEVTTVRFFLVYLAFTAYGTLLSAFGVRMFDVMNKLSMWSSDASSVGIFITLLVCAGTNKRLNSIKFVFGHHENITGYPDGVAWLIGLLQSQYALVGVDGAAHMINEIESPHINSPKAMFYACVFGPLQALLVLTALAASITDIPSIIDAGPSAMLTAFSQGVGGLGGGTALTCLALLTFMFNVPALITSASRMVEAFAADKRLPGHAYIGTSNMRTETPLWSCLFCAVWFVILGALNFASDTATSAILSTSVILLQSSYVPPIILVMLNRKHFHLRATHGDVRWNFGTRWGLLFNFIALAFLIVTSTFFFFPQSVPVTSGEDMNWCIAVVAAIILLAALNWVFQARRYPGVPDEIRNKMGVDFDQSYEDMKMHQREGHAQPADASSF